MFASNILWFIFSILSRSYVNISYINKSLDNAFHQERKIVTSFTHQETSIYIWKKSEWRLRIKIKRRIFSSIWCLKFLSKINKLWNWLIVLLICQRKKKRNAMLTLFFLYNLMMIDEYTVGSLVFFIEQEMWVCRSIIFM
jgi:hypothetical protein